MKEALTIEQSAELIKRGVSADKASKRVTRQVADSRGREIEKLRLKRWKNCVPYEKATMTNLYVGLMRFEHKEIFTLPDLLSLLPTSIMHSNYKINIAHNSDGWNATYIHWDSCLEGLYVRDEDGDMTADELIDALYNLLLWAIDHNHVKLD